MKQAPRFVGLVRVSSREQEREGFSLDVQEDGLQNYARRQGGSITKLFRVAETASKPLERRVFQEFLAYARKHAHALNGVLLYKVDRGAHNLIDYVELERLESEHGLPLICVTQPTENTPAGRMGRRVLASMASFFTEQQSVDVREGQSRRVQSGLFVGKAPCGYRNIRPDGRSLIEVDESAASNVRRIFELYAYHEHTLDGLIETLASEGRTWSTAKPRFTRSKLHMILHDRSYVGEVFYQGQWHTGSHPPLVDRPTFDRVQVLLGGKAYNSHESVYGAGMVVCAHCGRPVVVEVKTKKTKTGVQEYRYYRCAGYTQPGHPRIRVSEAEMNHHMLDLLSKLKIAAGPIRDWFTTVLQARTGSQREQTRQRLSELQRQLNQVKGQKDQLIRLRVSGEIEADAFTSMKTELQVREAGLVVQVEATERQRGEEANLVGRVIGLLQTIPSKWLDADIPEKRRILDMLCCGFRLQDKKLVPTFRKPFDVLVGGYPSELAQAG